MTPKRPEIIMVAGSNGSGKSTLVRESYPELIKGTRYINPDEIAIQVAKANPQSSPAIQMIKASREALVLYKKCINEKISFTLETTLAGNSSLQILEQAKKAGYHITLAYVGIETPEDAVLRVRHRVKTGGHDVPDEDIIRRYERSLNNFPKANQLADITLLFDNSGDKHQLQLMLHQSLVKNIYTDRLPNWLLMRINEKNLQINKNVSFKSQNQNKVKSASYIPEVDWLSPIYQKDWEKLRKLEEPSVKMLVNF